MKILYNGNVLVAEFDPIKGIYLIEIFKEAFYPLHNCYSIRTGNFALYDGTTIYHYDSKRADNHEELILWVEIFYPDFKF
jgi:hypothetical protein